MLKMASKLKYLGTVLCIIVCIVLAISVGVSFPVVKNSPDPMAVNMALVSLICDILAFAFMAFVTVLVIWSLFRPCAKCTDWLTIIFLGG